MLKRLFRASAVVLVLVPQVALGAFSDVRGTRYNDAFLYLEEKGAVQAGRPYDFINRAEALKVIVQMHSHIREKAEWYKDNLPSLPLFIDYYQGEWFTPYIEAGFESGIVNGYPDRTFRPSSPVKTEEALALLMRAYGKNPPNTEASPWYRWYADEAVRRNIVYGGEKIYLNRYLTRGQFFDMVYRFDFIESQQEIAFIDPEPVQQASLQVVTQPVFTSANQVVEGQQFAISIPKLGIENLTVTHPSDTVSQKGLLAVLKNGVGHLFSYPGNGGKIMIYGHSSGYSWDVSKYTKIFTRVNELREGDEVYVSYKGQIYTYRVTTQETIDPTDVRPFQGSGEELILFTCWPVGTAKSRLIVRAVPVDSIAAR